MSELFKLSQDVVWSDIGDGIQRAVLVSRPELMMVAFRYFDAGVGALHSHPHAQTSYVAEGRFQITIEDEMQVIGQGASFIVPPGALHEVKPLEPGMLIDAFAPRRDDFL